jgi:hypothetical protein
MNSTRRSRAAGIQNYLSRFDENADTAPQQATPLCVAVNTLPAAPTRDKRRFAESCEALGGFFMELSPGADEGARIPRNRVVRDPPKERESGAGRGYPATMAARSLWNGTIVSVP